jgi:hypothetical protein
VDHTTLVAPGYCLVNTASTAAGASVLFAELSIAGVVFTESVAARIAVESNAGLSIAESVTGFVCTESVFDEIFAESCNAWLAESILGILVESGDTGILFIVAEDVSFAEAVLSVAGLGVSVAL